MSGSALDTICHWSFAYDIKLRDGSDPPQLATTQFFVKPIRVHFKILARHRPNWTRNGVIREIPWHPRSSVSHKALRARAEINLHFGASAGRGDARRRAPSGCGPQARWLCCSLLTYRPGYSSSLAPRQRAWGPAAKCEVISARALSRGRAKGTRFRVQALACTESVQPEG